MCEPFSEWGTRVTVANSVPEVVRKAFRLARLEKPGATHIELPEAVAAEPNTLSPLEVRRTSFPKAQDEVIEKAAALINGAKAPLILAGNGVTRRDAVGNPTVETLRRFVQTSRIPAAWTYMAKGVLDPRAQGSLGPVGLQREKADLENLPQLAQADLVIAIGYDLVEWAPVLWNPRRDKIVIHVDSTAAELDGHYHPSAEVVGEIDESLTALATLLKPRPDTAPRSGGGASLPPEVIGPLPPAFVVRALREALGPDDVVISDVGAHKVWLARHYSTERPNTVVISNGLASMGIALPGAIAAKLVRPERKVVAFSGDGGFLMNVQELETPKRRGGAIVAVFLVDGRLGVIEGNERRLFRRTFGTTFRNPAFLPLPPAFGVAGLALDRRADLWRVLPPAP